MKVINNESGHEFDIGARIELVAESDEAYIPPTEKAALYKLAGTINPGYAYCWWLSAKDISEEMVWVVTNPELGWDSVVAVLDNADAAIAAEKDGNIVTEMTIESRWEE